MCDLCKIYGAERLDPEKMKSAFNLASDLMKAHFDNINHISDVLAKLMGVDLPEYDPEADGQWEITHRA